MREVVYLSDGKLRQFLPIRGRRWPRASRVNVTTPFGGAEMERAAADTEAERLKRLGKVVAEIQSRVRVPEDPGVRAGHWIEFEARLHQLTPREFAGMLLFLSVADAEGDARANGPRLLLHGSAAHLANAIPQPVDGPADETVVTGTDGFSSGPTFFTQVVRASPGRAFLSDLEEQPSATDVGRGPGLSPLPEAVGELVRTLDRQTFPETAARMRGFARVSAEPLTDPGTGATFLVASPLLVEYATAGQSEP
ncbi:SAVMC3_10250 family protein [Streptomyces sp. NPDC048172]|uniref:SAVMC3_10250 family protein n=1 Tax=Streptomyces sp. NPDC048172 TaxID=3365505 RepID=UPI003719B997